MKNLVILALVTVFLSSCNQQNDTSEIPESIEKDLGISNVCILKENISIFSDISSFTFINDTIFAISTVNPAQVFLYHINGNQLLKVGKPGNGPYEYISPTIIRTYQNRLYVWCSTNLKIIVFDIDGNSIFEYTNFNKAIKDFQVTKKYIAIYSAGGFKDPIIQFYNLDTKEFSDKGFGDQTNEHKILNAYQCSGALTSSNDNILFAPIDESTIYNINIQNFAIKKYSLNNPDFNVQKVNIDHVEFMADIYKSTEYIFGSDIITGLYSTESNYILTGEVGKIEMQGLNFKDISKRRQLFCILDKKLNPLYTIKSQLIKGNNNCLYAAHNKSLYNITYYNTDSLFHLNTIIFLK